MYVVELFLEPENLGLNIMSLALKKCFLILQHRSAFLFVFIYFFIVKLQLSAFSPQPSTPPQSHFYFERINNKDVFRVKCKSFHS